MKRGSLAAVGLAVLLCSCGNKMQTREAVERGVRKGVAQRGLSTDAMDISVTNVEFHGGKADAVVAFAPKGGKLSDGLTMSYTLEQRGNEWVIVSRSHLEMKDHSGGMQPGGMQPGSTQPGRMQPSVAPGAPLPPGHPAMGGTPR